MQTFRRAPPTDQFRFRKLFVLATADQSMAPQITNLRLYFCDLSLSAVVCGV